MIEILLKSLASAVVTALILLLAKVAGPKLAGALGGIPIVFAISYVLITMEDKLLAKDFLIGGIYGALAAIIFSIVLMGFNAKFPEIHWINFAVAYCICFASAYFMTVFVGK